jgi:YD repeat-containing protein
MRTSLPLCLLLLSSTAASAESITYSYDTVGRLTGTSRSGGPNNGLITGTSYDEAGNRTAHATGSAAQPIANASIFSISGPAASVTEGSPASFTVTRTGTAATSLRFAYATTAGTAGALDFTQSSGTLAFLPLQTQATISIPTTADSLTESAEQFSVSLSSPSPGGSIGTGTATATIAANGTTNHAPTAVGDTTSLRVCETVSVNVLQNDSDQDGDTLSVTSATPTSKGSVSVNSPFLVFTADGSTGSTSTTYTVSDGHGGTATAVLAISVLSGTGCN